MSQSSPTGLSRPVLSRPLAFAVLLLAGVAPVAVHAADTPPVMSGNEIVVTAERRASTVQSTPISMTALSGAQLQARGVNDLQAVVRDVPGISMRTSGPGQTELEMRGLASSGGSSPTVGFYLDEVPLSPPAASLNGKVVLDPNLFDLNRVEVLRGPQGTLYGSGSMGGTVKLITNEPKLDHIEGAYDLSVSATEGGHPSGGGDLMINLPLVKDKLALRVVGTEKYTGGWVDRIVGGADFPLESGSGCGNGISSWAGYGCVRGNVDKASVTAVHHDVNWTRLSSLRGSLLYRPDERLSVTVNGMWAVSSIPLWSRHGQRTMRHRPMPGIRLAARMPIPRGSSIVRTTPIAWSSTPRSARLRTS